MEADGDNFHRPSCDSPGPLVDQQPPVSALPGAARRPPGSRRASMRGSGSAGASVMAFRLPGAVTGAPRSHSGVRAETAGAAWPAAGCCVRPRAGRPVSWRRSCASRAERPEPPFSVFSQPLNRTGSAAWAGSRSRGPAKSRPTKRPSRREPQRRAANL